MRTSEELTNLTAALEDVEWARNSGDGSVSTDLVDELTAAVHRFVGLVHRQQEDQATLATRPKPSEVPAAFEELRHASAVNWPAPTVVQADPIGWVAGYEGGTDTAPFRGEVRDV